MIRPDRSFLTISAVALRDNWSAFAAVVGEGVGVMPVVKANAYGHGLHLVCQALQGRSDVIPGFVVDQVAEGRVVREYFPEHPIFCLGWTPPEQAAEVVELGLVQTVVQEEDLPPLIEAAKHARRPAKVNIEVETGLHRLGVQKKAQSDVWRACHGAGEWVEVMGMSSHFAEAEMFPGRGFSDEQNAVFYDAMPEGVAIPFRHISCTASTVVTPAADHTHVRLGIGLYGLWPSEEVKREGTLGKRHVALQPALRWTTRIAQIKEVPIGGTVGYGRTFTASRITRIAVVPVGYADGLDRRLTGQSVLVKGARCPIVGKICMNMCMIDVSAAPQTLRVGDVVTLIGREGMTAVTLDDWARALGTIHYEVAARLSPLVPRVLSDHL